MAISNVSTPKSDYSFAGRKMSVSLFSIIALARAVKIWPHLGELTHLIIIQGNRNLDVKKKTPQNLISSI
jgi:hypothetical protein